MNMKKGFTLIEIMIVVAIIAILAAIAIPNFIQYRQTAQINACAANIKTLNGATEAWRVKSGAANSATPDKNTLVGTEAGKGYIKDWPTCKLAAKPEECYSWDSNSNSWKCAHTVAD